MPPKVKIDQGTYTGRVLESTNHPNPIEAFLGVRYAQPPVGNLRFARPVTLPPSDSIFQASDYGCRAPSQQFVAVEGAPVLEESEDCLTANIFRWRGTKSDAALPIMVYFHGGAYNRGTASMHDTASMLSHSAAPFLAISFNYRLGALGFLNCSFTAEKGLLNVGLHDQVMLLEWVQANAAAFGGDPKAVTLIGLSAGAHSIGHHILNINEKRELFHRAVIESGAATSRATHRPDSKLHEAQFAKFLSCLGLAPKSPNLLADLRAIPIERMVAAQNAVFGQYNPSIRWAWQPVIDNDIISRVPLEGWRSGRYHDIPILTGFNHNEGARYVPRMMGTSQQFRSFFKELLPQLSDQQLDRLEDLYPDPEQYPEHADKRDLRALDIGAQYARIEKAYGHYAYVAPVRQTAHLHKAETWLYHWALKGDVVLGANHADQMWYEMMAPARRNVSHTHEAIANAFHGAVTRFIVHGDPGVDWRPFGAERETMVFGRRNDEAIGGKEKGEVKVLEKDTWGVEECKFWWEVKELGDL
ncbi:unnamed protein product [Zymoseptoria tritici ST99CH_1A5]|uniref:Carboxylic ester hydrolase n=1 Tax=Zymoseptoria tritici ST99CH_1A5 TaxID=1276529 RepID=A0A1Y6LGI6_ZYMTR|nr:unnamed protein product [Zymoseptoria tritici ST99CH_1A5]